MIIFPKIIKLTKAPYRKKFIFSLISACVLIIINYFINNASLFTGESTYQYAFFQEISSKIGVHKEVNKGNVIYFNNSFDKTLVPVYKGDYNKKCIGNTVTTDRAKLIQLLNLFKTTDTYKYVIVDLIFDKRDITEYDDSLFTIIKDMRDIVFVDYDSIAPMAKQMSNKSAKAFYYNTPLITNFSRYQYSYDGSPSIAFQIYKNLYPEHNIKRYGFSPFYFYFDNGKLCQNSVFLTFDNQSISESNNLNINDHTFVSTIEIENIGEFLSRFTESNEPEFEISSLKTRTKDKILFIGNTEGDIHDTYMGQKTGGEIILRALTSLEEGKHIVNPFLTFCWLIIFWGISFTIIINKNISALLKNRSIYRFFKFILSILTYSIVLLIFSFLEYVLFDRVYSILVPIIYFSFLKLAIQFKSINNI